MINHNNDNGDKLIMINEIHITTLLINTIIISTFTIIIIITRDTIVISYHHMQISNVLLHFYIGVLSLQLCHCIISMTKSEVNTIFLQSHHFLSLTDKDSKTVQTFKDSVGESLTPSSDINY